MKSLVVLCLALIITVYGQGVNQKCAQNGEYCLTHNDCCSRSCLSFSYKCVPVPPSASVGSTVIPVSNTFENRFGGSGGDGGASLTQKTCALEGEYVSRAVEIIMKNSIFKS
uniref:Putative secreted protein n=1 Tax=Anopheles braziliensis TaxID=58242 RepID=A0A2M3ZM16_9DIPT